MPFRSPFMRGTRDKKGDSAASIHPRARALAMAVSRQSRLSGLSSGLAEGALHDALHGGVAAITMDKAWLGKHSTNAPTERLTPPQLTPAANKIRGVYIPLPF